MRATLSTFSRFPSSLPNEISVQARRESESQRHDRKTLFARLSATVLGVCRC